MSYDLGDFAADVAAYVEVNWHVIPDALHPLTQNISVIVGLSGLSFAIYQWYRSYDSKMFARLDEILKKDDVHLTRAREQLVSIISAPGPAVAIMQPTLADQTLRSVIATANWRSILSVVIPDTVVDQNLDKAISDIRKHKADATSRVQSLTDQLATAHVIKGAILAARAKNGNIADSERNTLNGDSLTEFQEALKLPGHENDKTTRECVAEQFTRLRNFREARAVLTSLSHDATSDWSHYSANSKSMMIWRQADTYLHEGKHLEARKLMKHAFSNLKMPNAIDVRTRFQIAKMHETHFYARLVGGQSIKTGREISKSLESAKSGFEQVIQVIAAETNTLDKWLASNWNNWWNESRTSELSAACNSSIEELKLSASNANKSAEPVRTDTNSEITTESQQRRRMHTRMPSLLAWRSAKQQSA